MNLNIHASFSKGMRFVTQPIAAETIRISIPKPFKTCPHANMNFVYKTHPTKLQLSNKFNKIVQSIRESTNVTNHSKNDLLQLFQTGFYVSANPENSRLCVCIETFWVLICCLRAVKTNEKGIMIHFENPRNIFLLLKHEICALESFRHKESGEMFKDVYVV